MNKGHVIIEGQLAVSVSVPSLILVPSGWCLGTARLLKAVTM